jgi:hypothetical protein
MPTAALVFRLEADPNAAPPIAASCSWLSPLVLLGVDHVIVLVDMQSHVRRISIFLFDTPAVTVVIANDCSRGVRTQSDKAKQLPGAYPIRSVSIWFTKRNGPRAEVLRPFLQ